jgi:hypothetical protein
MLIQQEWKAFVERIQLKFFEADNEIPILPPKDVIVSGAGRSLLTFSIGFIETYDSPPTRHRIKRASRCRHHEEDEKESGPDIT